VVWFDAQRSKGDSTRFGCWGACGVSLPLFPRRGRRRRHPCDARPHGCPSQHLPLRSPLTSVLSLSFSPHAASHRLGPALATHGRPTRDRWPSVVPQLGRSILKCSYFLSFCDFDYLCDFFPRWLGFLNYSLLRPVMKIPDPLVKDMNWCLFACAPGQETTSTSTKISYTVWLPPLTAKITCTNSPLELILLALTSFRDSGSIPSVFMGSLPLFVWISQALGGAAVGKEQS
jgi:hypothetical protein